MVGINISFGSVDATASEHKASGLSYLIWTQNVLADQSAWYSGILIKFARSGSRSNTSIDAIPERKNA